MIPQSKPMPLLCSKCQGLSFDDSLLDGFASPSGDNDATLEYSSRNKPVHIDVAFYEDRLPDLPGLHQSYQDTRCAFCYYLRAAIIKADIKATSPDVHIDLSYRWFSTPNPGNDGPESLSGITATIEIVKDQKFRYLFFKVESNDENVARWLGIMKCPQVEAWCSENIAWVQNKLDNTTTPAKPLTSPDGLPTRLIDLGEGPVCSPRLVHTDQWKSKSHRPEPQNTKYCALSYCWGNALDAQAQLKTTKDVLSEFCNAIPQSKMTEVMKDTMTVCQSLHIRYIWIDALCIIQNDKEDWERESSKMEQVYSNAYLTLCAISSSSTRQSFLKRDTHRMEIDFQSRMNPSISGKLQMSYRGCQERWEFVLPDPQSDRECSWSTRGWTYQEDMLSYRKLLFGRSMLHFQCNDEIHREDGAVVESESSDIFSGMLESFGNSRDLYQVWDQVLLSYGGRNLTNVTDLLPAISGLAREFGRKVQDTYLAGLWRNDILHGLLWGSTTKATDQATLIKSLSSPAVYLSPSWSRFRDCLYVELGVPGLHTPENERHMMSEIKDLQAWTCPNGLDTFGRIDSGTLTMRAKLRPISEYNLIPLPGIKTQVWATYLGEAYYATCILDYECASSREGGNGTSLLLIGNSCREDDIPFEYLYLSKSELVAMPDKTLSYTESEQYLDKAYSVTDTSVFHAEVLDKGDSHFINNQQDHPIPHDCCDFDDDCCDDGEWCFTCDHCIGCCTAPKNVNTHAWGLVIYPTGTTGQYYRVGIFTSRALSPDSVSGINAFDEVPFEQVEIV